MRVVLASRNAHKARELQEVLAGWEVAPLRTDAEAPDETGTTFYENARAKAEFGRSAAGRGEWVVGEDSGLEVVGLGGAPGIYSARYAGPRASDGENVARLLEELAGMEGQGRRARYLCELVCLSPAGEETRTTGTLEGRIAPEPRGAGGFGYDPVFVPRGETATVAELGDAWKAERSHRARAARQLARALEHRAAVE